MNLDSSEDLKWSEHQNVRASGFAPSISLSSWQSSFDFPLRSRALSCPQPTAPGGPVLTPRRGDRNPGWSTHHLLLPRGRSPSQGGPQPPPRDGCDKPLLLRSPEDTQPSPGDRSEPGMSLSKLTLRKWPSTGTRSGSGHKREYFLHEEAGLGPIFCCLQHQEF